MRLSYVILNLLLISVFICIGCSNEQINNQLINDEQTTGTENDEQTTGTEAELLDAKMVFNPSISMAEIKETIKISRDITETISILGNNYDSYPSYYDYDEVIRYYFTNNENYSYQYSHVPGVLVEDLDVKGLLNEEIKYMLSLYCFNNILNTYALAYKHDDGKIHVYYEFADGTTKEDILDLN